MKAMPVLILAGGRGTRMRPLTDSWQKCMLRIGGKPILGHVMDTICEAFKPKIFIIATSYKGEQVEEYFRGSYDTIPIVYIKEDALLGFGGSMARASALIQEPFLTHPGDVIIPASDIRKLCNRFSQQKNQVLGTLLLSKSLHIADTHALVYISGNRISKILSPRPQQWPQKALCDTTVAAYHERFLQYLLDAPVDFNGSHTKTMIQAMQGGEEFGFVQTTGTWSHFAYSKDLLQHIG